MDFIWLLVISIALVFVFQVIFVKIGKNNMIKLSEDLYLKKDINAYTKRLNSIVSKFYFNQGIRLLMMLDPYIMTRNTEQLKDLAIQIDNAKISNNDRGVYLQKVLMYAIDTKDFDYATMIFKKIEKHYEEKKFEHNIEVYNECVSYYNIFVKHDDSYAEEMETKANQSDNEIVKGMYYYRAAKCYYYRKDIDEAKKNIEKASELLKQTEWNTTIQAIKNNIDLLKD